MAKDPSGSNLRQLYLLDNERLLELLSDGYDVGPGALAYNLTL